jgi:hypothetical protein
VTKCGTVSRVVWGQGMEAVLGLHGLPWLSLSRQLAHVDSGGYCTTASNHLAPCYTFLQRLRYMLHEQRGLRVHNEPCKHESIATLA